MRFIITLVPRRGVDGVRALRRLLKHAGRYYGLTAVDVREEEGAGAHLDQAEEDDHAEG